MVEVVEEAVRVGGGGHVGYVLVVTALRIVGLRVVRVVLCASPRERAGPVNGQTVVVFAVNCTRRAKLCNKVLGSGKVEGDGEGSVMAADQLNLVVVMEADQLDFDVRGGKACGCALDAGRAWVRYGLREEVFACLGPRRATEDGHAACGLGVGRREEGDEVNILFPRTLAHWERERNAWVRKHIDALVLNVFPGVGGAKELVVDYTEGRPTGARASTSTEELSTVVEETGLVEVEDLDQAETLVGTVKAETDAVVVEEEDHGGGEWGRSVVDHGDGGKDKGVEAETGQHVIDGGAESCGGRGEISLGGRGEELGRWGSALT